MGKNDISESIFECIKLLTSIKRIIFVIQGLSSRIYFYEKIKGKNITNPLVVLFTQEIKPQYDLWKKRKALLRKRLKEYSETLHKIRKKHEKVKFALDLILVEEKLDLTTTSKIMGHASDIYNTEKIVKEKLKTINQNGKIKLRKRRFN